MPEEQRVNLYLYITEGKMMMRRQLSEGGQPQLSGSDPQLNRTGCESEDEAVTGTATPTVSIMLGW